jgi:hypothetical protein
VSADAGGIGSRYRVDGVPSDPQVIAGAAAWCASIDLAILELRVGSASLEDRYFELTGDADAASGERGPR